MKPSGAFLASCLVVAVHAADLFQIGIITGAGEKASVIASLNQLERTYRSTEMGYGAFVEEPGVYCKAFSDPHGRDSIGDTFSNGESTSFADPDTDDPVHIGSFYCSAKGNILGPGERPSQAGGDTGGDEGADDDKTKVQFRTGFNSFTKGFVPLGEKFTLEDSDLGDSVVEAMVVSIDDSHVKCQLLGGEDGKKKLGDKFSVHSVTLGIEPVTAKSVLCNKEDD